MKEKEGQFVPKNDEAVEVKQFPNTPFTLVSKENECFVSLGKYRISQVFKTESEAVKWVNKNNLKLLTDIIGIITQGLITNELKIKSDE